MDIDQRVMRIFNSDYAAEVSSVLDTSWRHGLYKQDEKCSIHFVHSPRDLASVAELLSKIVSRISEAEYA